MANSDNESRSHDREDPGAGQGRGRRRPYRPLAHVPMIPDVRAIAADVVLRTMTTGAGNRVTSMIANVVAIVATMISVHVKMAVPAGGVMSAAGMTGPPRRWIVRSWAR